ncbi:CHAP domain-containing protein [Candidatus Saccharibacteria bacterium]|nr:CHAP domain-containing protein [Candidatus Saccharibacteria bacterium]
MKHTKTKIFLSCTALIIAPVAISLFSGDTSAVDYCVSDKCKAAQAAEQEAKDKAEASTTAANTLEGEVERLNNEIAIIESRIATNQATADDLAKSIKLNEEKLAAEQEALAEMLVDIYFDGEPDALTLLASSSSISEYAAKQAQMDTVKTQINLSAESVKLLKEELEQQKLEVERIIADQETQRTAVAAKRNEQATLIAKYRDNAAAYAADAEAARKIKEAEMEEQRRIILASIAGTAGYDDGNDSYPYSSWCKSHGYEAYIYAYYGYYAVKCQCTDYAAWMASTYWGLSAASLPKGNAKNWGSSARSMGYRVDTNPEAYTVAVSTSGYWGHVMWVHSVNGNGTVNISEYNGSYEFNYATRTVSTAGLEFIHFN